MARGKCLYKSATCSAAEVDEVFKKHLDLGEDILGITIGSAFSGMNNLFSASSQTAGSALSETEDRGGGFDPLFGRLRLIVPQSP
jgi:fatty acid-binding protein DegV